MPTQTHIGDCKVLHYSYLVFEMIDHDSLIKPNRKPILKCIIMCLECDLNKQKQPMPGEEVRKVRLNQHAIFIPTRQHQSNAELRI